MFWCISLERSDLSFIGTGEGDKQTVMGGEAKEGDKTNMQQPKGATFVFNVYYRKNFSALV